jgi:hypothetical protein
MTTPSSAINKEIIYGASAFGLLLLFAILAVWALVGTQYHKSSTLADAIDLLPNPEYAVEGRKLSEYIFWVHTTEASPDEDWPGAFSWIVNTKTGKTEMVPQNHGEVGVSNPWSYNRGDYFVVNWSGGWDGATSDEKEYFSRSNGRYLFTASANNRNRISVTDSSGKVLELVLLPEDICNGTTYENSPQARFASGLEINGEDYAFPRPIEIECNVNNDGGPGHQEFTSFRIEPGQYPESLYIDLGKVESERAEVAVPIYHLDNSKPLEVHYY